MTILSAAKEVGSLAKTTMKSVAKAISSGSLRGARGNSGVILSQLFRGFTKVIAAYDTIDTVVLAEACDKAVETAYKAVMKPKEGTILTVARGAADKAIDMVEETDDLCVFIRAVIDEAERVLKKWVFTISSSATTTIESPIEVKNSLYFATCASLSG